jgi:hypothetical protein
MAWCSTFTAGARARLPSCKAIPPRRRQTRRAHPAVETRPDAATGEVGSLVVPGQLRAMLAELLGEQLSPRIGCTLDVDGMQPIVLIAHSGGYQAAAAALQFGDLPAVQEVVLFDALYGASGVFFDWMAGQVEREEDRWAPRFRFVDLYTCCGGTEKPSKRLASDVEESLSRRGLGRLLSHDEGGLGRLQTVPSVVFAQVPDAHSAVPRTYFRSVLESSALPGIGR